MTSYLEAGVDLEGAERHAASIAGSVIATWSERVVGGFGGFAAGVRIPTGYRDPVLMMSTDGVGTKLDIARRFDRWEGVGFDLVSMCVDDLAATGAAPIGLVDYLAVGSLRPERDTAIVESIAAACRVAGCPLLGGETAEHPDVMAVDAVDLAGAVMGVVEEEAVLGPARVQPGDLIVGLMSPNLRSNGFSLVRTVFGEDVQDHIDTLLQPSVIYSPAVLRAVATGAVHAGAHITGGGLIGNLSRVLPDGLGARIEPARWERPGVFDLISQRGVSEDELQRTFNLGIGFCLIVTPDASGAVLDSVGDHDPRVIGSVVTGGGVKLN